MYRRIGDISVDPAKFAGCDSIVVEIDDRRKKATLKVSFFRDDHYQDEIIVTILTDKYGINTDADVWKRRCLGMAADFEAIKERCRLKLCKCGNIVGYNSYFDGYYCPSCGSLDTRTGKGGGE